MKKLSVLALSLLLAMSCKKEEKLSFSELNSLYDNGAVVELNIPQANSSNVGATINAAINNHISSILNFSEDDTQDIPLEDAIKKFKTEYATFKAEYEESALIWEATFDGEVVYQSKDVITIAISSYTNTGGAHGNSNITLYNFNPQTGNIYTLDDMIKNEAEFTAFIKPYFLKEINEASISNLEDYFYGDDFHLPANIGFNSEGLLLLYNVYEIASYARGITEFTIPLDQLKSHLKIY